MVFVRVRKIVIAMWWKGDPGAATRPAVGQPGAGRVAAARPVASLEAGSPAVSGHSAGPAEPTAAAEIGNVMRLLWRRFSAVLKSGG